MPELPEVELLARQLNGALVNVKICGLQVLRPKSIRPTSTHELHQQLIGSRFINVTRRAKYLCFALTTNLNKDLTVLAHLGMTGRFYLDSSDTPLPKHGVVSVLLDNRQSLIFEDTRYFGGFHLDHTILERLGPEPLNSEFTSSVLFERLQRIRQCIKPTLMAQNVIAGIGNIYASEILFRSKISPLVSSHRLSVVDCDKLHAAIRETLRNAIAIGSKKHAERILSQDSKETLFYYPTKAQERDPPSRFQVYDRKNQPCHVCHRLIERIVQASRSTFYCPFCQKP